MAHSPGPWAIAEDNLPYGQIAILCDGVPIANVMNVEDFPCCEEEMEDLVNEQAIATARLMAAAPDLLAALQLAKFDLTQLGAKTGIRPPCIDEVDAAIKKAKGE